MNTGMYGHGWLIMDVATMKNEDGEEGEGEGGRRRRA